MDIQGADKGLVVILRQAHCNQPKDLVKAVKIMDEGNAGGLTHTKGCKCTMSDREGTITLTSKKSKVSVPIRTLVSLTEFIFSIDGNRFPHQASCWEEAVKHENIC